jgi:CBS domain containing-hemolysin-like protein
MPESLEDGGPWAYGALVAVLVVCAVTSGLNLSFLELDATHLQVLKRSGSEAVGLQVGRVEGLLRRHHVVVLSLVLLHAIMDELLPIVLEYIVPSRYVAVAVAVPLVLIAGELIPSVLVSGRALAITSFCSPVIWAAVLITGVVSAPLAWVSERVGGHDSKLAVRNYRRNELSAFLRIHQQEEEGEEEGDDDGGREGAGSRLSRPLLDGEDRDEHNPRHLHSREVGAHDSTAARRRSSGASSHEGFGSVDIVVVRRGLEVVAGRRKLSRGGGSSVEAVAAAGAAHVPHGHMMGVTAAAAEQSAPEGADGLPMGRAHEEHTHHHAAHPHLHLHEEHAGAHHADAGSTGLGFAPPLHTPLSPISEVVKRPVPHKAAAAAASHHHTSGVTPFLGGGGGGSATPSSDEGGVTPLGVGGTHLHPHATAHPHPHPHGHPHAPHHGEGGGGGGLTAHEVRVIEGTLGMATRPVSSRMVPFERLFTLSADEPLGRALLSRIAATAHSRIPVYAGEDRTRVVGLLLVKLLLRLENHGEGMRVGDLPLIRPLVLGPATTMLGALKEFEGAKAHMAVITGDAHAARAAFAAQQPLPGEGAGVAVLGILTLEDCLLEVLNAGRGGGHHGGGGGGGGGHNQGAHGVHGQHHEYGEEGAGEGATATPTPSLSGLAHGIAAAKRAAARARGAVAAATGRGAGEGHGVGDGDREGVGAHPSAPAEPVVGSLPRTLNLISDAHEMRALIRHMEG